MRKVLLPRPGYLRRTYKSVYSWTDAADNSNYSIGDSAHPHDFAEADASADVWSSSASAVEPFDDGYSPFFAADVSSSLVGDASRGAWGGAFGDVGLLLDGQQSRVPAIANVGFETQDFRLDWYTSNV